MGLRVDTSLSHDGDMTGSGTTGNAALFGDNDTDQEANAGARERRAYALSGMLQVVRARHGWSVEQAAIRAGVGHMTWRRAEQGVPSRLKTYATMDRLFELPAGTINRAVRNDELLVELAGRIGVDVTDARNMGATAWVAKYAEVAAATTPAGRMVHLPPRRAPQNPDLLGSLGFLAQHLPATVPTDLQAATDLVDRMAKHDATPEIRAAIDAVLRAIPDLIGVAVRSAATECAHDAAPLQGVGA